MAIDPQAIAWVQRQISLGEDVFWFTDGSCQFPTCVTGRFAAFSIVLDTSESATSRINTCERFLYQDQQPTCFQPVVLSRVRGEQDILRAELSAIAQIVVEAKEGQVHSDSQGAITLVHKALTADHPSQFLHCDHFDILLNIWHHRRENRVTLHKVKAHQDLTAMSPGTSMFLALGNAAADRAAVQANDSLLPDFVQELRAHHQDIQQSRTQLEQMYRLHLDIVQARKLATPPTAPSFSHDPDIIRAAFVQWRVDHTEWIHPVATLDFLDSCTYGRTTAEALIQWLTQLKWPTDNAGPTGRVTGLCWGEAALSFMFFWKKYLPVIRQDRDKQDQIVFPGSVQAALHWHCTLVDMATSFVKLLDQVIALTPENLIPSTRRCRCTAMYIQGVKRIVTGWHFRPEMPFQTEVVDELQRLTTLGQQRFWSETPRVQIRHEEDDAIWDFQSRHLASKARMHAVRTERRRREQLEAG
eukprot:Skav217557  [mRNA]  locus=scaffold1602:296176:297588:+ [translate_table: standard]